MVDFRAYLNKIKNRFNWLAYYGGGGYAFMPTAIYVAVNTNCNMSCHMCDAGSEIEDSSFAQNIGSNAQNLLLSLKTLEKLIKEVYYFRPWILITSREPLLHPDIIQMVQYIKQKKLPCHITTNGYLLEALSRELVESGLDSIGISVDGPPGIHNRIRNHNDAFQRAIAGIKKITDLKKRLRTHLPRIGIYCTVSDLNFSYLQETINCFEELDISFFKIVQLNFITTEMAQRHNAQFPDLKTAMSGLKNVNLARIDTDALFYQLKAIGSYPWRFPVYYDRFSRKQLQDYYQRPGKFLKGFKRCRCVWQSAQIDVRGDVLPKVRCYSLKFGNINEEDFKTIWNNVRFRQFRKELKRHGAFSACARCSGVFVR